MMKDNNKMTPSPLLTLQEAAARLGVPVEILLQWNDNHILTPRITRTGQIGYTPEQIAQFIAIRDSLQTTSQPSLQNANHQVTTMPSSLHPQTQSSESAHTRAWLLVVVTGVVLTVILASQQARLSSLLQHSEQESQASQRQAQAKRSDAQLDQSISLKRTSELGETAAGDHLHKEDQGIFSKNIFVTPTPTQQAAQLSRTITQTRKVLASSSSAESMSEQAKRSVHPSIASVEAVIDDTSTLAEKTSVQCPTCQQNQSPNSQLELGKTPDTGNRIATTLGDSSLTNTYPQQRLSTVTGQAVFFVFGSLGLLLFFTMRQRHRQGLQSAPAFVGKQQTMGEKVLEINQKMDGTVVLSFKGKDYKISKPELDSDSDRFIERLMELMTPGMKELEYESSNDALHLTTPLSRIVTRLGFVGIKRDLFFPRTSKHRVLFRRYVTTDDLSAMNMTVAQLQDALALPNQG